MLGSESTALLSDEQKDPTAAVEGGHCSLRFLNLLIFMFLISEGVCNSIALFVSLF
jgi:hypothetical protein